MYSNAVGKHAHTYLVTTNSGSGYSADWSGHTGSGWSTSENGEHSHQIGINNTGGGNSHENRQPYRYQPLEENGLSSTFPAINDLIRRHIIVFYIVTSSGRSSYVGMSAIIFRVVASRSVPATTWGVWCACFS